jgi:hypothetical protein
MKYSTPKMIELGKVEKLTHWRNFGNWADGLGKFIFAW